jgi:predicted enzyme related to lactoylglutathione lyase
VGNEPYYLIHTGPQDEKGINGGMKKRTTKKGALNASIPTIGVPDAKKFAKLVKANGGKVTKEPKAIPGTGYIGYCEDTEGNQFAILQYDADAK